MFYCNGCVRVIHILCTYPGFIKSKWNMSLSKLNDEIGPWPGMTKTKGIDCSINFIGILNYYIF